MLTKPVIATVREPENTADLAKLVRMLLQDADAGLDFSPNEAEDGSVEIDVSGRHGDWVVVVKPWRPKV